MPRRPYPLVRCLVRLLLCGLVGSSVLQAADPEPKPDAEKVWAEVKKATRQPDPPAEWGNKPPTPEQREQYRKSLGEQAAAAAAKARAFYTAFPDHARAAEAKQLEKRMVEVSGRFGHESIKTRAAELEKEALNDPSLSEDDRFRMRSRAAQRAALDRQAEGQAAVTEELEKQTRQLMKDFPNRAEPYDMLVHIASGASTEHARELVQEILASGASEAAKDRARALARKSERVGQPLAMQFTAVDGREVDLAKLKGKVVLIDFWATWCGPCVAELPAVKAAYEKLHAQGFEIVGISFDSDRKALTDFVAREKTAWPQYFDGKGWENKFGREYGITGIPTMWLIDRQGKVRDLNARGDLAGKVAKLLAEPN